MFISFENTGRIRSIISVAKEMESFLPDCVWSDENLGWDTHYINLTNPDNPTPTERPPSPVSRTGPTLLDVPTGSTLYINGVSYPAEGEVEVLFTYPGTYALRVECFPYLDWTDEVVIP